jgi:hypothetical protein
MLELHTLFLVKVDDRAEDMNKYHVNKRKSSKDHQNSYLDNLEEIDNSDHDSGFYANQDINHDLRRTMNLYTGYSSDELEEDMSSIELK